MDDFQEFWWYKNPSDEEKVKHNYGKKSKNGRHELALPTIEYPTPFDADNPPKDVRYCTRYFVPK